MLSNYHYIPPEQNQLLIMMHICGTICCSLRRMGKVIWTKSPPMARVDNVVYFDDIFVVAGGH